MYVPSSPPLTRAHTHIHRPIHLARNSSILALHLSLHLIATSHSSSLHLVWATKSSILTLHLVWFCQNKGMRRLTEKVVCIWEAYFSPEKMATRRRTTGVLVRMGLWSNLPSDVIQLISEKIMFKEQYAHFRLVCQQWWRSCPPHPRLLIDQLPWLLLPHDPVCPTLSFYGLSPSKIYNFDLPDVLQKNIFGGSRGWILLEKDGEFSLINPITGEMKSNCLPSLAAPPNILAFARNKRSEGTVNPYHVVMYKIILTSSPSDEGCIVVAEFSYDWELGFCKVGDSCWTVLKFAEYGDDLSDFKYKNGLVYAVNYRGQVTVYDLRNLSRTTLISNLSFTRSCRRLYLVIGEGELDGVLLAVRRVPFSTNEFEVYKCINGNAQSRWARVRNIGNAMLFLGAAQCECVSLDSIQLYGWEQNHVCFYQLERGEDGHDYDIIKLSSIENVSVRDVPNCWHLERSLFTSWFAPSLR
ncbi:hypothetical protein LUZ60_005794 [Juncus effusus]|nr:hypothetical protein LUZ60_005794 [Juncus effusus]